MEKKDYMHPKTMNDSLDTAKNYLEKDNDNLKKTRTKIQAFLDEDSLKGNAYDSLKLQMESYKVIIDAIIVANQSDIDDMEVLRNKLGDELLNGEVIVSNMEIAQDNKKENKKKVAEYSKAALNATNDFTRIYYNHQMTSYQIKVDSSERLYDKWKEKSDKYDEINAVTSNLFINGKELRNKVQNGLEQMGKNFNGTSYTTSENQPWIADLLITMQNNKAWDGYCEKNHNLINEYSSKWNINFDDVEWTTWDAIRWITVGGDEFLFGKKAAYLTRLKDVIKDASNKYGIPEILLAGILFNEYGGDPHWADDAGYALSKSTEGMKIAKNPELVSFGNPSLQIRRVAEIYGYDPKNLTDAQTQEIINDLRDPVKSTYITAAHLKDLKNIDYKDVAPNEMDDTMIRDVATRYNRGPDISLNKIHQNTSYGDRVINHQDQIKEALGD